MYPLYPLWIFEFLELETQKVCKNILKRRNVLKKNISSAKNEKLHLFQALENCTFWILAILAKKMRKIPKMPIFQAKK